jgi:2-keto-3-deoxy-L-rhamnonate aldolase RhmA
MISSLQQKLNSGQAVMGTWSIVANAALVEIGAMAGLDFHILDLEHGAYDMTTLEQAIRASEGAGSAPLVRVPDLTPSTFQKVLDLGAHGIVAPQIKGAEDAERVVQYARYAPRGVAIIHLRVRQIIPPPAVTRTANLIPSSVCWA